jgi:glycine cleavage system aminomethyltransferase T
MLIKLDRDGRALYSAMLNEAGGVLDDLIVYRDGDGFRIVVNCATREKDLQWMTQQTAGFDCTLMERSELSILAIQGPESLGRIQQILREHDKAVEADLCRRVKALYRRVVRRLVPRQNRDTPAKKGWRLFCQRRMPLHCGSS